MIKRSKYGNKINTYFHNIGVSEKLNVIAWQSFLFILCFFVKKKRYLQIYLDECVYNIVRKQMIIYL